MPSTILCPACRKALRLPSGGPARAFRCPHCGGRVDPASPRLGADSAGSRPAPQPAPDVAPVQAQGTPAWVYLALGGMGLISVTVVSAAAVAIFWMMQDRGDRRAAVSATTAAAPAPAAPTAPTSRPAPAAPLASAPLPAPAVPVGRPPEPAATTPIRPASPPPPPPATAAGTRPAEGLPAVAVGDGGLDAALLDRLKTATVFIKVRIGQSLEGSGSGLVFWVDGTTAYVATNAHVINPLPRSGPGATPAAVTAVFASGAAGEAERAAEVLASDPDWDLAVLKVTGVAAAPTPFDLAGAADVRETMALYVLGFPLGRLLGGTQGANPAVTVSRAAVSSLRRGRDGRLAAVQLDGELNPGNSGGPIVDLRGRLVGVAVAKLSGTTISFAIPVAELRGLVAGRVGVPEIAAKIPDVGERRTATVSVAVRDPLHRLRQVRFRVAAVAADAPDLEPDATGAYPPLPGGEEVLLEGEGATVRGTFSVALADWDANRWRYQFVLTRDDGTTEYSPPYQPTRRQAPGGQVADGRGGGAEAPPAEEEKPDPGQLALIPIPTERLQRWLQSVAFSPDGRTLAVAAGGQAGAGTISLWDGKTGAALGSHPGGGPARFTPDGRRLVFMDGRSVGRIRELATRKLLPGTFATDDGFPAPPRFACTADGKGLLVAQGALIRLHDLNTLETKETWRSVAAAAQGLAVSPTGKTYAAAVGDQYGARGALLIKIGDMTDGTIQATCQGHTGTVVGLAYAQDGRRLFSAGQDGKVHVWEVATGKVLDLLEGPSGLTCLALAGHDRLLAVGANDGTVRLLAPAGGELATLHLNPAARFPRAEPGQGVTDLAFTADGQRLAAGAGNGRVKIWDVAAVLKAANKDLPPALPALPAEVTQPELPPAKPGQPVNLGTRPVAKLDQVPEPQAGQEPSLAGEPRTEGTAAVTPLDKVAAKTLVPCLAAAADGHAFYALDGGGLVRRIAWNQFKEERRIELGHKAAWLAVSAEGPVVTLPDLQEAWVLDPVSLKIKARISLPGVIRVTAAPALAYGVAVSKAAGTGPAARIPGRGGELLQIFGLKRAGTVKTYHPQDFPAHSILGLNDPVLTPDGKYLFTQDGSTLSKWQVGDGRLIYKETSERIGSGAKPAIHVSPDGAYVCLTSGGGNLRNQPNHPDPGAYGTYVYAVGDLKRPAFTITQGAYPAAVAFDPKAKLVYAQNIDTPLLAFSMAGAKSAEFKLGGGRRLENEVRQFLTHPAGGQVLVLQGDRLTFVNLGK